MKVDKITKDLIGREARLDHWKNGEWETILCIDGNSWWGRDLDGTNDVWDIHHDWEIKDLPEPRKKPSERIREIIGLSNNGINKFSFESALLQYLDEREEKENK